jgi:type III secretion control protein HpaP
MTRPRAVSFQSLEVHRPVRPEPRKGTAAPGRPSFSDLLRLRRGPAAVAGEDAEGEAPVRLPVLPGGSEEAATGGQGDGDAQDSPRDPDAGGHRDDPHDWVASLAPTPAMIETMLRAPSVSAPRGVRPASAHPMVASVAQTVARFCNEPAVDHSEGWSVRMPLRDDVLPETTLDLTISSCWLQLRFETRSDGARDLLSIHRAALTELLAAALNRQRDIAITIE